MGSGSSRIQLPVDTTNPEVSDVVRRTKARPLNRQSTIDKTVTETGAEIGKLRPVLKMAEYSFDEDDVPQEGDIEGLQDIEGTPESLGIAPNSDLKFQRTTQGFSLKDVKHNTETKWKSIAYGEYVENVTDGNGGWTEMSVLGAHRHHAPLSKIVNNHNDNNNNTDYYNNSESSATKLSKISPNVPSAAHNGIHQKNSSLETENFCTALSRDNNVELLHPHRVPDYNTGDQQILDNIEREWTSRQVIL